MNFNVSRFCGDLKTNKISPVKIGKTIEDNVKNIFQGFAVLLITTTETICMIDFEESKTCFSLRLESYQTLTNINFK